MLDARCADRRRPAFDVNGNASHVDSRLIADKRADQATRSLTGLLQVEISQNLGDLRFLVRRHGQRLSRACGRAADAGGLVGRGHRLVPHALIRAFAARQPLESCQHVPIMSC